MNSCKTCGDYLGAHALPEGKYEYQRRGFCSPSCALIPELETRGNKVGGGFWCDMNWDIIELDGKKYQVNFQARYVYEITKEVVQ